MVYGAGQRLYSLNGEQANSHQYPGPLGPCGQRKPRGFSFLPRTAVYNRDLE